MEKSGETQRVIYLNEIPSFLITFRETLEAALIVGIVLAYLTRTGRYKYHSFVYLGVGAGIVGSVVAAMLFGYFAGGMEGPVEEMFEGFTMLAGAALITFMIIWLMNQRHVGKELEGKVERNVAGSHEFGLFFLVFVSVLREGVETVLFLNAASFAGDSGYSIAGSLGGIVAAIALGYVLFSGMMKVNLGKVFMVTGILLVLFAAGLVAHGLHELEEAGLVPAIIEHVWDMNPPQNPDGSYPLLHDNGAVGGVLKGLFGYNGDPSLIEVLGYAVYIAVIFTVYRKADPSRRGVVKKAKPEKAGYTYRPRSAGM